ncbi:MAG: acetylornithine/LysW-gamma-L-lysine aminotransferase [Planctomycetota bacterium]|jgi:acetylornithine/LysW-gamma-L-lysine aminotransferase
MSTLIDTSPAGIERRLGPGLVGTRETTFVQGQGARLFDVEGRSYIDCSAAHGCASLGHAHPRLVEALTEQAGRLISCTPSFANDQRAAYLRRLHRALPAGLDRIFFCNSGTEAVEAALKFARLSTGRTDVVACVRGFHGRTMGALSATHEKRYREPFAPLVPGFRHIPYDRPAKLEEALDENTAAFLIEIVQGEGGVRAGSVEFLAAAREACDRVGALLIVDEVQTGFGRTGKLFAVQHSGVRPDLLCLAKGMAGGMPMGAVAIGSAIGELPLGSHGSTFGGNPLACAAASAVLEELLVRDLPAHAERMGERLREGLRSLRSERVREVRGMGLMIGVELRERVAPILEALLEAGVVALPAGPQVLRLLPPLIIGEDDVDLVIAAIGEVLA